MTGKLSRHASRKRYRANNKKELQKYQKEWKRKKTKEEKVNDT
ncbi:unnamed protein product [marine sediment metagenome]|uniref:Uncharacterized protein n=1 Tax=marine sediment metagenome TaxID=412755 RepID=X1C203_9ZZZZ